MKNQRAWQDVANAVGGPVADLLASKCNLGAMVLTVGDGKSAPLLELAPRHCSVDISVEEVVVDEVPLLKISQYLPWAGWETTLVRQMTGEIVSVVKPEEERELTDQEHWDIQQAADDSYEEYLREQA